MKIVLLLVIHVILRTHNAEAKEIPPLKNYPDHLSQNQLNAIYAIHARALANVEIKTSLSISDLWNKIKNSIANAWNAIKDIANKTKEKINVWIQDIKKRAEEAIKVFEAKLEELKDKLKRFIEAVKKVAGDVKECIQEDKSAIQELLKQIAIRVSTCIVDNIKNTTVLATYQSRLALEDKEFGKAAEEKLNKCVNNDNTEECLNKARGEIYDDMEHHENGIMDTRIVSRNLVDDALETIKQCVADGIIEASEAITAEVIKIVNCVINRTTEAFDMK